MAQTISLPTQTKRVQNNDQVNVNLNQRPGVFDMTSFVAIYCTPDFLINNTCLQSQNSPQHNTGQYT